MKHRAVAVVAALSVVVAGALAAPAVEGPAPVSASVAAAAAPASGSPAQSLAGLPADDSRDAPPARRAADMRAQTPPAKDSAFADGALATVVEAIAGDEELPDELAGQVSVSGDRLRVEVTHTSEARARAAIGARGGTNVATVTDTLLVADVPVDALDGLESEPGVTAVTLPNPTVAPPEAIDFAPLTVGTKGDDIYTKTQVSQWHRIGLTGDGISIGIVDYFNRAAWKDARAKKEIPGASGTFCRSNGKTCDIFSVEQPTGLHGIAVAEAIHDMAPDAKIYIATVSTNADLKKAIDFFASHRVRIMSRSLGGFFDGPGNGQGSSAALVDYAVEKGITWFNSAGNSAAYVQTYRDGSKEIVGGYWRQEFRDTDSDRWHEFVLTRVDQTTGKATETYTSQRMWIVCGPYFRLRWNDWRASVPTDYDIYRFVNGKRQTPGYSPNFQTAQGDKPLELQAGSESYFRCTEGDWIEIGIYKDGDGDDGGVGDILELQGTSGDIAEGASSPYSAASAFNDSDNPGFAAIGAVDPVAGVRVARYSSRGPTNDGRIKPELSAGSNFTSRAYTYGGYGGRFNGTSAATPVVAGAAALVAQRYRGKTPAEVIDYLRREHTEDRGVTPGVDNAYGTGELIMHAIPVAAFTSTPAPKISGSRSVGSTLTVAKPTWSPTASFTYRWYRGTTAISGATKSSYTLTKSDIGQKIRVRATGSRGGFRTTSVYSAYTTPIVKVFTTAPKPTISGVAKVGRTLTATAGAWSPTPTRLSYQWKADGAPITGATGRSYVLRSSDAGKRITVTVTAERGGYKDTLRTSAPTQTVAR